MIKLAVTGGIACGKSRMARFLADEGIPVCEADDLARTLTGKGQPAYRSILDAFGPGILDGDGQIDRRLLGRQVFAEPSDLHCLNRIVHPGVRAAWERWMADQDVSREKIAAVVIPLLYEIGDQGAWDVVVCVSAPRERQLEWVKKRGFLEEEAAARIRAQKPVLEKRVQADYVVENIGTEEFLREQIKRILKRILEK